VRSVLAGELGLRFERQEGGPWRLVGISENVRRAFGGASEVDTGC
jgi:hypothetical protein